MNQKRKHTMLELVAQLDEGSGWRELVQRAVSTAYEARPAVDDPEWVALRSAVEPIAALNFKLGNAVDEAATALFNVGIDYGAALGYALARTEPAAADLHGWATWLDRALAYAEAQP